MVNPPSRGGGQTVESSAERVEQDRWAAVKKLAQCFGAQVLLKGAGSLVAQPDSSCIRICTRGTPALAVGGAGDVLSGIAGSLIAQGLAAEEIYLALHGYTVSPENMQQSQVNVVHYRAI